MDKLDLIKFYFNLGLAYKDILHILSRKHRIILSLRTLKRILKKNGLFRRIHFDSLEETVGFIKEQLQGSGALHGYRWMHSKCKENGLHTRKEDDELDSTKETWNSHVIRPSSNEHVPHGRPDAMHLIPELYDTEDYLSQVSEEDLARCEDDCVHRSDIACDGDVFTLCTHIMAQNNLNVPVDAYTAIDLYLFLRGELIRMLNLDR
ncbi:hypothetical protein FQA47_004449 [Oryzias melastigma]|uniref:Uncharacterized protein n=1 Tax=Oryzias melastigma TaxID=30732 RepID=A0A834KYH5_ORYME|nr:hypothetical protein FQA47_004449 [Oryzias melastigma]